MGHDCIDICFCCIGLAWVKDIKISSRRFWKIASIRYNLLDRFSSHDKHICNARPGSANRDTIAIYQLWRHELGSLVRGNGYITKHIKVHL